MYFHIIYKFIFFLDDLEELLKSKYSKFFVLKLLKYGYVYNQ